MVESRFSLLSPTSVGKKFVRRVACADIARWSGRALSKMQVSDLYNTPLSVGGIGHIESVMSGSVTTVTIDYQRVKASST